ncbi:tetratricopeptide repeat protein [Anthocerotibacter panamensis]|uniref:hypothetical protein n=1 Tax=Anthocerotibacter panamensis TaxID=2857077 RepID=UPI001C401E92|nr:hypothetical protein [Anthocerotibacter panamensis]
MKKLFLMLTLSALAFPTLAQTTDALVMLKFHESLAANYLAQGNSSSALEEFNTVIELDPSLARAYIGRADANRLLNHREEAIEDYKTAIKLYATHQTANFESKIAQYQLDKLLNESSTK